MKRYMTIREYSRESGFPEKRLRALVKSDKGFKFSDTENGRAIIIVPIFEKMLDSGEIR